MRVSYGVKALRALDSVAVAVRGVRPLSSAELLSVALDGYPAGVLLDVGAYVFYGATERIFRPTHRSQTK